MSAQVIELEELLRSRDVWRGNDQQRPIAQPGVSTGVWALDEVLPSGGWPVGALTEVLAPFDGVGELELLWPALAALTAESDGLVVLVAPRFSPYAPAWHGAGVRLDRVQIVEASARDALWTAEQCLRAGACSAVVCWPQTNDDRMLRRLQSAAESGQCHGFAIRPSSAGRNPSPAPVRVSIEPGPPRQLRVLKCRGAHPPSTPILFPARR